MEIKTTLGEYTDDYEGAAEKISRRFTERGWLGLGEVEKIVAMSY